MRIHIHMCIYICYLHPSPFLPYSLIHTSLPSPPLPSLPFTSNYISIYLSSPVLSGTRTVDLTLLGSHGSTYSIPLSITLADTTIISYKGHQYSHVPSQGGGVVLVEGRNLPFASLLTVTDFFRLFINDVPCDDRPAETGQSCYECALTPLQQITPLSSWTNIEECKSLAYKYGFMYSASYYHPSTNTHQCGGAYAVPSPCHFQSTTCEPELLPGCTLLSLLLILLLLSVLYLLILGALLTILKLPPPLSSPIF